MLLIIKININNFLTLGMAGAGKTSFTQCLSGKIVDGSQPYLVNLDPACTEVPYPANIGKFN